jgi:hypothetical protein
MFGNKHYELSLVKDYVSHWGLSEAARELIQNSLDSNSPFAYSFEPTSYDPDDELERPEYQGWVFRLKSEHSRLEPRHLLLGSTGKAQDKDAIGSFGEGFKIALLVLTRLGFPVTILNNERTWTPRFRMNKQYGAEMLYIEEELGSKATGLEFIVYGLDDTDRATIEACCLKMQSEIGQIIPTSMGDILVDRPGELYVGSLFVCKTEMKFGYDVKPQYLKLERDRQTVSSWDLRVITRDMWYQTKRHDEVAKMVFDEVPDLEYAKYSTPEIIGAACYEIFKKEHPGMLIAESHSEMKAMIERGLTKTVYLSSNVGSIIKSHPPYRADTAQVVRVRSPREHMQDWYDHHYRYEKGIPREHRLAFEALLKKAEGWKA